MSSFAGLSTALSSLIAQRQALEVAGQNVANANTPGYTRQRADMVSVESLSAPTMFSTKVGAGVGVKVTNVARLGDVFLDARLRSETATSSFSSAQARSLSRLESTLSEPADTGVAASLQAFWAGWQDVANNPQDPAARKVLVGTAGALTTQLASGHRAVETQWDQARTETRTLTTEVNTTAAAVAHLNEQIRSVLVSGGSANELMDQRDLHITRLAGLVGAAARPRDDGTVDVMVGGNALVRGVSVNAIEAQGSYTMAGATAGPSPDPVRLVWANTGTRVELQGGTLSSHLAVLAPATDGGTLARAAASYDDVARTLHDAVNALHRSGYTTTGATGLDFFTLDATRPPALGLSVAVTSDDVAAGGDPTALGPFDGSVADALSRIGASSGGPDALWRDFVVDVGVRTRTAEQRANVTEAARATAENLRLSQTSVDLDEETISMLAYQRAYEGAARVLTVIDEMLDVLINRTGVVGR